MSKLPLALVLSLLLGLSTGCSTVPKETPKGKAVQVIKGSFTKICTQLGKYLYNGTPFIHDKELMIILKEDAAQRNGNAIRLDTFVPGVTGVSNAKGVTTVFKCPAEKLKAYVQKLENAKNSGSEEEITGDEASSEEGPMEELAPPPKTKSKSKRAKQAE